MGVDRLRRHRGRRRGDGAALRDPVPAAAALLRARLHVRRGQGLIGRWRKHAALRTASQAGRARPSATWRALAEVSIGTASKALNGNGRLRQETREQGDRGGARARLPAQRSGAEPAPRPIDDGGHHLRPTLSAASPSRSSRRWSSSSPTQGIAIFMCNATDDPAREQQHLDQLLGKRIDGLRGHRPARRQAAAGRPLPAGPAGHLCLHAGRRSRARCRLLPDDEGGARLAVQHLIALGRKRIAHITGPERFEAVRPAPSRLSSTR